MLTCSFLRSVESQIKILARAIYSNPPMCAILSPCYLRALKIVARALCSLVCSYGARLVATVLQDPKLKAMWQNEIGVMSGRIIKMRTLLKDNLKAVGSKKNWDHITNQIGMHWFRVFLALFLRNIRRSSGMFSYTGVSPTQCDELCAADHGLPRVSRLCLVCAGPTSITCI